MMPVSAMVPTANLACWALLAVACAPPTTTSQAVPRGAVSHGATSHGATSHGAPSHAAASRGGASSNAGCDYVVTPQDDRGGHLSVELTCHGTAASRLLAKETAAPFIASVQHAETGAVLPADGATWVLPSDDQVRVRYKVDLTGLASAAGGVDTALQTASAVVAPASSWLLRPADVPADLTVRVTLSAAGQNTAATQQTAAFAQSAPDGRNVLEFPARELRAASYAVFGQFQLNVLASRQDFPGRVRVAVLDGPLAVQHAELLTWVQETVLAVARFWGQMPAPEIFLAVVPVPDKRGVAFGKLLPAGGMGIVLLVGEHTSKEDLYADWILTHELFHVGFPSLNPEGRWLDEGLATYFEPLIRARAGWLPEQQVFAEFTRDMPQGLDAVEVTGLGSAQSWRDVYWGGAIIAFAADAAVRRETGGALGLEHGLRALLQRGANASRVWQLKDAIAVIDDALPRPVLAALAGRHTAANHPVNLDALFNELGVLGEGAATTLSRRGAEAARRRALLFGQETAP